MKSIYDNSLEKPYNSLETEVISNRALKSMYIKKRRIIRVDKAM